MKLGNEARIYRWRLCLTAGSCPWSKSAAIRFHCGGWEMLTGRRMGNIHAQADRVDPSERVSDRVARDLSPIS